MKSYCTDIKKDLPVIILMSHGPLAEALWKSAVLIAGAIDNIAYLCLEEGDNPQEFIKEVKRILDAIPCKKLVMVDLLGGTPCNSFAFVVNNLKTGANAVSGMNLPMLLEIISCRKDMNDVELADAAEISGKESICNVNEKLLGKKYGGEKNDCINQD